VATRNRKTARKRRSSNADSRLPGWAWLFIGALLALGLVLVAPQYLKPDGADGFFRPPSTADALSTNNAPDTPPPTPPAASRQANDNARPAPLAEPDYDFYTVLPEPDAARAIDAAELAAPRTETERPQQSQAVTTVIPATTANSPARTEAAAEVKPITAPPVSASTPTTKTTDPATNTTTRPGTQTRTTATAVNSPASTLLQAGAFLAPADAEALKARIALLGLQARVESATADGQTVYRVRLGPYPDTHELSAARQRLQDGGLSAREIRR